VCQRIVHECPSLLSNSSSLRWAVMNAYVNHGEKGRESSRAARARSSCSPMGYRLVLWMNAAAGVRMDTVSLCEAAGVTMPLRAQSQPWHSPWMVYPWLTPADERSECRCGVCGPPDRRCVTWGGRRRRPVSGLVWAGKPANAGGRCGRTSSQRSFALASLLLVMREPGGAQPRGQSRPMPGSYGSCVDHKHDSASTQCSQTPSTAIGGPVALGARGLLVHILFVPSPFTRRPLLRPPGLAPPESSRLAPWWWTGPPC
jgi:hypothetical protein